MSNVEDLINAIGSGSASKSNDVFNTLMQDKLNDALNDKKIELAQQMSGTAPEVETEEEIELEDDAEV